MSRLRGMGSVDPVALVVDVVLFDLDGTLLDHRGAVRGALQRWLPTRGVAFADDAVGVWLAAEDRHFPEWRAGRISLVEQRRRRMVDFLNHLGDVAADSSVLDALFGEYLVHFEASWCMYDDVLPAIDALRAAGLEVAVLTNGESSQQAAKLHAVGLADLFGEVLTASELGAWKPDPSIFHMACERLAVAPSRVVHVGDRHDLDVVAPRTIGMHAIHLDRTGEGPLAERDRIESLHDLLAGIDRLSPRRA